MASCYRHPGRETGVSCSNCGRPICPDCMTSTSVGMRCPECARQRTTVRRAGTGAAGARAGAAPATYALIAVSVAAFVAELAAGGNAGSIEGGGELIRRGGLNAFAVADLGEPYRIVTSAFLHAGPLHLLLNMFALYILGTLIEPAIGTARFLGLYLVSLLAGSFGALLLDPGALTVGASGAVFGLMASGFVIARRRGLEALASQIALYVGINLVFTFSVPNISVGGHLGGLVGGALAALVVAGAERRAGSQAPALEALALAALAGAALAGSLLAAAAGA